MLIYSIDKTIKIKSYSLSFKRIVDDMFKRIVDDMFKRIVDDMFK